MAIASVSPASRWQESHMILVSWMSFLTSELKLLPPPRRKSVLIRLTSSKCSYYDCSEGG